MKFIMQRYLLLLFIPLFCFSCKSKQPELRFSNDTYDFGEIQKDSIYNGCTLLENIGNDTLKVFEISPDCSCTNVYLSKNIILPKEKVLIDFSYRTYGKYGSQTNFITLITNTDTIVHLLQINANVR